MNTFSAILLLFGNLGTTELIVILVVVLLLFGGRKIPELMHGIGKGVRSFKKGMNEIEEEIKCSGLQKRGTEKGRREIITRSFTIIIIIIISAFSCINDILRFYHTCRATTHSWITS